MPVVRMPDGAQVSFPDDMPKEQIRGLISQKFPDAANENRSFADKATSIVPALGKGIGTGISELGLGLVQTGLKNGLGDGWGTEEQALQATKDAATKIRNSGNKNIDRNPVAGTIGQIAPQIGSVAGLGLSLPGIIAGGAGLGYLTPDVNQEEIAPGGETALGRLLRPVAETVQSGIGSMGIDPNSGGGKALQGGTLAGLMGGAGKAIPSVTGAINRTTKATTRGVTKIDPDAVAAFEAAGVEPSLLTTTNNELLQRGANNLKNVPFAGGVIEKRISNDIGKLATNVEGQASKLGTATDAVEGGLALQQGLTKAGERAGNIANKLYQKRDSLIPEGTPAVTNNIERFSNNYLNRPTALDAAVSESQVNRIAKATQQSTRPQPTGTFDPITGKAVMETPTVPYKTLTNTRSQIGEKSGRINAPSELKGMYGALSEDMAATAKAVSPQAEAAAIKANNFYRGMAQRQDKLKRFVTQDADGTFKLSPEKMANASREELALLKRTIPKADFDNYAASELRQLGRARSGVQNAEGDVFSPATYLTEWDKLGSKKGILFGENTPLVQELNKTAKVAEKLKNLNKTANTSNTSNNALAAGSLAALIYLPKQAFGIGGGGYVSAKLLTSPKVLRVINNYAYRPVTKSSSAYKEFSTKLFQAAGSDPELRREVGVYLNNVKQMGPPPKAVLEYPKGQPAPLAIPKLNDNIDAGEYPALPNFQLRGAAQ